MEYFRLLPDLRRRRCRTRAAAMVADFLCGRVQGRLRLDFRLLPQAAAGKLRRLAFRPPNVTACPRRADVAESGYPGFELTTDFVLLAPGGTPDRDRGAAGTRGPAGDQHDRVQRPLQQQDIWIVASTSAETASRIKAASTSGETAVVRTA